MKMDAGLLNSALINIYLQKWTVKSSQKVALNGKQYQIAGKEKLIDGLYFQRKNMNL